MANISTTYHKQIRNPDKPGPVDLPSGLENSPWTSENADAWNKNFASFDIGTTTESAGTLIGTIFGGPIGGAVGNVIGSIAGNLLEELFPSDGKSLLDQSVDLQKRLTERLDRQSQGQFTDEERAFINYAHEPMYDAVYSNFASRGVAESPHAQAALEMVEVGVFHKIQERAQNALLKINAQNFAMGMQLAQTEPGLGQQMQGLLQEYMLDSIVDEPADQKGTSGPTATELDGLVQIIADLKGTLEGMK